MRLGGSEAAEGLNFTTEGLNALSREKRPRIDVKLFRTETPTALDPRATQELSGFFAIGIVGAKTAQNVGSLWRSAYQVGDCE